MTRNIQLIFTLVFFVIAIYCGIYLLPEVSLSYIKNDILKLTDTLFPISIVLSIVLSFVFFYKKSEFEGSQLSKIGHIFYILIMSGVLYFIVADTVLTATLELNKLSGNHTITKDFIIKEKPSYSLENTIWGIIQNEIPKEKMYYQLRLSDKDYARIKKDQEVRIRFNDGLFGVLYNPVLIDN